MVFFLFYVGRSKKLDREVVGRKAEERSHREVVGELVVDGELTSEVIRGIKGVGRIEALLIFSMAAFDLAVVPGSIGTNELVSDAELSSCVLKQGGNIPFGVGKAVGKLKAVVGLDALNVNPPASIPLDQPF